MMKPTRKSGRALSRTEWGAAGLSFLFFLCCVGALNGYPSSIGDDVRYFLVAHSVAEGNGYRLTYRMPESAETRYPPVFPYLLAVMALAYPGNMYAAKTVPMFFGVVSVALSFTFFRRRYGDRAALAISALVATNTLMVTFSTVVLTEIPLVCLSLATALAADRMLARGRRRPFGRQIGVAVWTAVTVLTRIAGLALLPALVLWLGFRNRLREGVKIAALAGVLVSPWFLWSATRETRCLGHFEEALRPTIASGPAAAPTLKHTPMIGLSAMARRMYENTRLLPTHVSKMLLPYCFLLNYECDSMPFVRRALVGPVQAFFKWNHRVANVVLTPLLIFLVVGFVRAFWRGPDLLDWYGVCYVALVLAYAELEYRFIVPLIPLLYSYLVGGATFLVGRARSSRRLSRLCLWGALGLMALPNAVIGLRLVRANLALPPCRGHYTPAKALSRCYGWGPAAALFTAAAEMHDIVPQGKVVAWPMGDAGPCYYFSRRKIRETLLRKDMEGSKALIRTYADYVVLFGRPRTLNRQQNALNDETFALVPVREWELEFLVTSGPLPWRDFVKIVLFKKVSKHKRVSG